MNKPSVTISLQRYFVGKILLSLAPEIRSVSLISLYNTHNCSCVAKYASALNIVNFKVYNCEFVMFSRFLARTS